jgi:hypothetical protein
MTSPGSAVKPAPRAAQETTALPKSVDETLALLQRGDYVAERSQATALYLSLSLGRPLFLEGEAGVGKTEIAKVLAETLGRSLIRPAVLRRARRRLGRVRVGLMPGRWWRYAWRKRAMPRATRSRNRSSPSAS